MTVYVEYEGTYTESGATFADNYDSSGSALVGGNAVDSSTLGTYTVTYNITDTEGNVATQVTRTVIVQDTTKPVITLTGDSIVYVEYEGTYTESGATYTDNYDSSGSALVGGDVVDSSTLGTYTVTYNITDTEGNVADVVTRTVTVVDTTSPTFNISDQTIEVNGYTDIDWSTYIENASDNYSTALTLAEEYDNVDFNTVGSYDVVVSVMDEAGNKTSTTINVWVVDTEIPVISLTGDSEVYVEYEGTYTEAGATYTDNYDSSGDAIVGGDVVDSSILGSYTVTYNITDSEGNVAVEVTRTVIVQDTTKPVISLTGDSTVYVEYEGTYTESGATFTDNYDTTGSVIVDSSTVDSSTLGSYTVTYNITDSEGNVAVEVTRTVIIRDTTKPVITLTGDSTVYVEYEGTYTELGATYTDNYDTSGSAVVGGTVVDSSTLGSYTVTYNVTDSEGNVATQVTRIVIVRDTTKPVITLTGDSTVYVEYEGTYTELGATFTDNYDASGDALVGGNVVDSSTLGSYTITYNITDMEGNVATQVTRTVIVRDKTKPVITLTGDSTVYVEYEGTYTELGATFTDNYDASGDAIAGGVVVDSSTLGSYTITYNITDTEGNVAIEVTRTVIVRDTTKPVITLTGDSTVYVEYEGTYTESGATFTDNYDTTGSVIVDSSTVDSSTLGSYTVAYNFTDSEGNVAVEVTRTVIVQDTIAPSVILNPSLDTIEVGVVYTDYGVTAEDATDTINTLQGIVDTDTPGVYVLTYTVTDTSGNATTIDRYVTVYGKEPVVEFSLDNANTTIQVDETYIDGTCSVNIDGTDYLCTVKANNIDSTTAGVYTVTYAYTYNDREYTYNRYIFVVDGDTPLQLYVLAKKEDGETL